MADILEDPTYKQRNDVISIDDPELGSVRMQGVVPKLRRHGGHVWRAGPSLGQDNDLIFRDYLGLTEEEVTDLRQRGIV